MHNPIFTSQFKRFLKCTTSVGLLTLGASAIMFGSVQAQTLDQPGGTSADNPDDVIIVTGRRRDAELSIEAKRAAKQVIDVLSADQASQLPDNNVAESLARIPGVTIQRSGETGNGNFISIRGLDSALNNIQFNGVNSGLANGGDRRVPLDGITADDIAEIRVAKSLLPQDEGEGIGGAVNIIAMTPLGRGKDRLTFDVSGRYGEFADKLGYNAGGSFTKVFNDKFGINLAASYRRRFIKNFEIDASSSNLLFLPDVFDSTGALQSPADILALGLEDAGSAFDNVTEGFIPPDVITFEEQSYQVQQQIRDTLTISGAIDWRPAESTLITLGGRLSRRETDATEFSITFDEDDRDLELMGGGLVTEFNDPEIDVEAQLEDQFDLNANIFLRGATELDKLTLNYQVSYARAATREPQTDLFFNTRSLLSASTVTFQPYSFVNTYFPVPNASALNDADFVNALSDIPGTQELVGFESDLINESLNERYAAKIDLTYDVDWNAFGGVFNNVRIGGKFERSDIREDKIQIIDRNDDDLLNLDGTFAPAMDGTADGAFLADFPGLFGTPVSLSPIGSPLDSFGITGIPSLNEDALRGLIGTFQESFLASGEDPTEAPTFFDGREDIFAGYFQTEFEVGNLLLTGGVRVEQYQGDFLTPLVLTANLLTTNGGVDENIDLGPTMQLDIVPSSASNTEILPRFNALYKFSESFQMRGGFGYSIARPTFSQLGRAVGIDIEFIADADTLGGAPILPGVTTASGAVAAGGIGISQLTEANISVTSGNPNLENARSLNADLTFEFYPARGTALTVGLFYKRINNFIFIGQESGSGTIDSAFAQALLSSDGQSIVSGLGGLDGVIASGVTGNIAVRRPLNGDVATLKGVEIGVVHQFTWAPGPFSDVGFYGNVTYADSEATYEVVEAASAANPGGGLQDDEALVALGFAQEGDGLVRETSFFNSPNLSANGAIYYEAHGLEVALSATYQSRAFDFTDDFGLDQFNGRYYQMDIFIGYDLPIDEQYGSYKVYFEVPDVTDNGIKPTDLQTVGRTRTAFDEASFNGREFRFGIRGRF
ncbi:MAG: TonB-dependent receptor [Alphaproteobacteria bacterium]|nr:TonB-dependent receptor [Alphaproteobacteria bacterium]